jgi:hypothetical protein
VVAASGGDLHRDVAVGELRPGCEQQRQQRDARRGLAQREARIAGDRVEREDPGRVREAHAQRDRGELTLAELGQPRRDRQVEVEQALVA